MGTRKTMSLVCTLALLCQLSAAAQTPPQQTPQEQAQLAEFTRVWNHAQELDKQGKTADAIAAANQALAIVRRAGGNNVPDVVVLLRWIAQRHERIDDFAAALFYERWLSGQGKHDALRAAQLEMRQSVRTRYGQDLPYYWAAFILVGR